MTDKKYPEAIYETRDGLTMTLKQRDGFGGWARRYAYDLGFKNGQLKAGLENQAPLEGWSNLTEAIKGRERIDWDALDGLEAKCVHPEIGTLTHKLERNGIFHPDIYNGWVKGGRSLVWSEAFYRSWWGSFGWSLYIKGDVPLRKPTADQLEPGTCFRGRYEKNGETHNYAWAQLLKPSGQKPRVIFFSLTLTTLFGSALPEDVEVVEVYGPGTFQTPKEQA